jgi:hypothetical protein
LPQGSLIDAQSSELLCALTRWVNAGYWYFAE